MANSDTERYYWVKISESFFDNAKIRLIQDQDFGTEAILLYIFLLAESASHGGKLRCDSDTPYTREEIGSLCRLRKEARVPAFSLLEKYRLVVMEDDGTIVMPEMPRHVGSETNAASRKREYRVRQHRDSNGTTMGQEGDNVPQSIEYRVQSIDNNIELKDKIPPTPKKIQDSSDSEDDEGHDAEDSKHFPERNFMVVAAKQRGISIEFLNQFIRAVRAADYKYPGRDGKLVTVNRSNFTIYLQAAWNDASVARSAAQKKADFVPPSQDEVKDYFRQMGYSRDPTDFWLYYQGRGWKTGQTLISDWKAVAASWERRGLEEFSSSTKPKGTRNGKGNTRNPNDRNTGTNYGCPDFLARKGVS